MRKLQVSIDCVWLLPTDAWSYYTVYNDKHGGLLAVVWVTEHYADKIEALHLQSADDAVRKLHRQRDPISGWV